MASAIDNSPALTVVVQLICFKIVDWVLTEFTPEERQALPSLVERAADAVLELTGRASPP